MAVTSSVSGVRLRAVTGRGSPTGRHHARRIRNHARIRKFAMEALASQRHRHSPSHPLYQRMQVHLLANLETMTVDRRPYGSAECAAHEIPITMIVRPLDAVFEFHEGFVSTLTTAAHNVDAGFDRAAAARSFLSDLRSLDGQLVNPHPQDVNPDLAQVFTPEHAVAMVDSLTRVIHGDSGERDPGAMTTMCNGFDLTVMPNTVVGSLALSAEGPFVGAAVGQPDRMSPRGTTYSRGLLQGAQVFAVVTNRAQPLLLHWEDPHDALTARQRASLDTLLRTQQSARSEFLEEYPMAVELSLSEGPSRLLSDAGSAFYGLRGPGPHGRRVKVTRDKDGRLRLRDGEVTKLRYGAEPVVATVDCLIEYNRAGHLVHALTYQVVEGTLPSAVEDFFALVAVRARKMRERHDIYMRLD